jgi:hypothetical protein
MTGYTLRPLSLGEVLDVAFSIYRKHFPVLLTIAVVTRVLPIAFNAYLTVSGGPFSNLVLWIIGSLLGLILGAIGVGATAFVISDGYLGNAPSASNAFHRALPYLGRLLMVSLLTGLAIFAGMLLIIVPGIIFACGLALSTQTLIFEDLPDAPSALRRSWSLTSGFRGKIFGALFVAGLLLYIPVLALSGFAATALISGDAMVAVILLATIPALLQVLIYPFFYAIFTVLYYDLRVRKEGFDLEMLASALHQA